MDDFDTILQLVQGFYRQSDIDWEAVFKKAIGTNTLTPENLLLFKERLEKMPTGSKIICKIILENPTEFIGLTKSAIKEKLYRKLIKRKKKTENFTRSRWQSQHWTRRRVDSCCLKIKKNLRDF